MLPLSKSDNLQYKVLKLHKEIEESEGIFSKNVLIGGPIGLIVLMWIFDVNYALRLSISVLMISIITLFNAFKVFVWIMKKDTGTKEMIEIADCITEGSEGYFAAQYGTIQMLSIILAIIIMFIYYFRTASEATPILSPLLMSLFQGLAFIMGAACSALSGYAGMWVSVRANIRVAAAARSCYNDALQIAFKGGYFAAVINVALALIGISSLFILLIIYFQFNNQFNSSIDDSIEKIPLLLVGFGFGASFVAMFSQLGGGIYTKAADVGADLIGKIEMNIPEDDPRNPAVIADLVGDNVGDCAGQAADVFESISAEIISAMILGAQMTHEAQMSSQLKVSFIMFPFLVHCLDLFASTVGMYFVRTKKGLPDMCNGNVEDALTIMKRGYNMAMFVGIIGLFMICYFWLNPQGYPSAYFSFFLCGVVGIIVSFCFVELTQYYTDYNYGPVQKIVSGSKTGGATNIIAGLSVGMESTGLPVLVIVAGVLTSFYLGESSGITNINTGQSIGGLFGTAVATMGMFTTGVFVLSMSGFGPIADNAGGIAEMSHQPESVRAITDRLDAVGNVTKANTKGYSVGSASLACFLLFSAFIDEINFISDKKFPGVDITRPEVYLAGLLGAATVFVFSAFAIESVGNAAQDVIVEVTRQFRENPGIMNGQTKPNYKQCVEIVAKAGIREMIKPGLLALFSPIIVGLFFRIVGYYRGIDLLGAQCVCSFLMFSTSTGILMALFLNNGGGAWDNAKKYIESGHCGGKGSNTHKAAVIGDTVGDPCKDTAGPSIHILIKLVSTITLVLAPIFIGK